MSEQVGNSCRAGIEQLLQWFLETGQEAIQSGKLNAEDMGYAKLAVDTIIEHRSPFMEILRFIDKDRKFPTLDRHVVNLLLAAYYAGQYGNVTNSARNHAVKESLSANGCKSVKKRREEAAETWHPPTKELTELKLKSDPEAYKAEIIRYVRDNWPLA